MSALSYLRRESADIYNRLHSIEEDVAFVNRVRKAYPEIPILRSWSLHFLTRSTVTRTSQSALWGLVHGSSTCKFNDIYENLPIYSVPTQATNVPAYFKSTDGHFNNWSFNLRRSNLHLLPLIIERRG